MTKKEKDLKKAIREAGINMPNALTDDELDEVAGGCGVSCSPGCFVSNVGKAELNQV